MPITFTLKTGFILVMWLAAVATTTTSRRTGSITAARGYGCCSVASFVSRQDKTSRRKCHLAVVAPFSHKQQVTRTFCTTEKQQQQDDYVYSIQEQLTRLEQEIATLNHGQRINVNSPRQVATAIFGTVQSTSRNALKAVVVGATGKDTTTTTNDDDGLSPAQKIAQLVLKHRDLTSTLRQQQATSGTSSPNTQAATFSTMADLDNAAAAAAAATESTITTEDKEQKTSSSIAQDSSTMTLYDQVVESLFAGKTLMDEFWREPLLYLTRKSASDLVYQLNPNTCPVGYDPQAVPHDARRAAAILSATTSKNVAESKQGQKGSLLAYYRQQKELYPDCIILMRVGDFYEAFGMDAIMLVEHCGLNPMGGKARAGCPIRNVQATLDCLTSQGFRVAVYEEAADTDSSTGTAAAGGSKSRLKHRFLAQIVSPAEPGYLYDQVLLGNSADTLCDTASRPYVGIISVSSGYTLVEVSMEEHAVRVSERLTAEAVACRLAAYPPADPLLYVPSPGCDHSSSGVKPRDLPFLPSRSDRATSGPGSRLHTKTLEPSLMQEPSAGTSDVERAKRTIVTELLQMTERHDGAGNADGLDEREGRRVTADDFTLVLSSSSSNGEANVTCTNPLYVETATQLGLMSDKTIPPLVSSLLRETAPAATSRFLRRWLLTPPPPVVAQAMSSLVSYLKDQGQALPPLSVPPIGKILALLRAGQASAQVYGELLCAMDATMAVLDMNQSDLIAPLMVLLQHESGMAADPESLKYRCLQATNVIEEVISPIHHARILRCDETDLDRTSDDFCNLVPAAFFERNEATWRGRVKADAAQLAYDKVQVSARRLAEAVAVDFWGFSADDAHDLGLTYWAKITKEKKSPIMQDVNNNIIAIKEIPKQAENAEAKYVHPKDRFGKRLMNRYTTERVQDALSDYVGACEEACQEVTIVLTKLSKTLCESGHIPSVVQAAHTNLLLSTASHHAAKANSLGWNMARTFEKSSNESLARTAGHFDGVWPYWMDRSVAVPNSFDLNGFFLLTAPNMSGKSTLMRSTAAAALLTNCGLCAPLGPKSAVRRFDNIFVRGASADIPTEQKSAFGAEMGDIAALQRSCGEKSLVFVDELGRGTSPRDGTALAGAILEDMVGSNMSGIFATHLHDIFDLPLKGWERIVKKHMIVIVHEGNDVNGDMWTYRLEDGVCRDSLSLVTAAKFGVDDGILERARELASFVPRSSISQQDQVGSSSMLQSFTKNGFQRIDKESNQLEHARRIAEEVIGQESFFIKQGWMAPPSLEGLSCLYILEVDEEPSRLYVGEADSLQNRLDQHRRKGPPWSQANAIAFSVPGGKTQARIFESRVIQKLANAGFNLISVYDGRSIRPSGRP